MTAAGMMVPFTPPSHFPYAYEAIDEIERQCCSLGCSRPSPEGVAAFGPGGDCELLATVSIGDYEPVDGMLVDATTRPVTIICERRIPV